MTKVCMFTCVLLTNFFTSNGQDKLNWKYFKNFTDTSSQRLIIENWKQYFKEDLLYKLDKEVNYVPVKLDSYGSLYPEGKVFNNVNFNFYSRNSADTWAYSIYDIFKSNDKQIVKNVKEDKTLSTNHKTFYTNILQNKCEFLGDEDFYQAWDDFHFKNKMDEINKKINDPVKKFKKVIFFIHGYNVPYSLANIQLIALKDAIKNDCKMDISEILFIPIFWTSNDNKNKKIGSEEEFDISNYTGLFNGGAKNGYLFLFYSNRAYYASITLRKMINRIENKDIDLLIFSHSLGATVVTSALINTVSKLHTNASIEFDTINKKDCKLNLLGAAQLKKDDIISYELVSGFLNEPIPTRKLKIFMSAPAIPGFYTFKDQCEENFKNKLFYSTVNLEDEMLTKKIAKLRFVTAHNFSSSSLGCDLNDAESTKQLFKNKSQFNYKIVSDEEDHDILTYLNQQDYLNFLKNFFNEK